MSEGRPDRPQRIALNRYDLAGQVARLRSEAPMHTYGRDSLTLVRDPGFTLLLVALNAGRGLPNHTAPGPITVLVVDGRVAFTSLGERYELGPHELVTLPGHTAHEVVTLEDCAILVTIAATVTHTNPLGLESERQLQAGERGAPEG